MESPSSMMRTWLCAAVHTARLNTAKRPIRFRNAILRSDFFLAIPGRKSFLYCDPEPSL